MSFTLNIPLTAKASPYFCTNIASASPTFLARTKDGIVPANHEYKIKRSCVQFLNSTEAHLQARRWKAGH